MVGIHGVDKERELSLLALVAPGPPVRPRKESTKANVNPAGDCHFIMNGDGSEVQLSKRLH